MARITSAFSLTLIMLMSSLVGCFSTDDEVVLSDNSISIVEEGQLVAGVWQVITIEAKSEVAVFIPHFIQDPSSLRAQNGTVLDLDQGEKVSINILLPPRNTDVVFLLGENGRTNWPIRAANQSWMEWIDNPSNGTAVSVAPNGDGGEWPWLNASDVDGGKALYKVVNSERPFRSDLGIEDGADASTGWVDGRSVYEWVEFMTDETPCPDVITCGEDGAVGYLDRWVGNNWPPYEDAIDYFEGVMKGFGLRTDVHRYWTGTFWAANICGYKDGTTFPDEWLVFGGHFDIAPYATPTSLLPGLEQTGYGTRTGAYDNSAGSAMVLTTAGALADFDARRTMVFCLWSSEEEGLWGSRAFADAVPSGITVSNYLNLDMAGVNYPGDYALSVYLGPDGTGDVVDQPGMFYLAEWIGADALNLSYQMERGAAAWAAGGESPLWGDAYEDTVAIYESPTARSDHDSFQDIGVATLGWNGLVDGFPCYHKTCDKLETMEEFMVTDEATGVANLANSWDIVTWWAVYAFLHMDQTPVPNVL